MMTRIVTICLILFTSPAVAWSEADTKRQAAYFVLHAIDWGQTLDISAECNRTVTDRHEFARIEDGEVVEEWTETYQRPAPLDRYEHNPILGTCPERGEVNAYFLGTAVAHYVIARSLSPKWRRRFQYVTIGFEAGVVASNFKIGLTVRF